MEAFTRLEATAVPIDIANCDTDQIIPARFLRKAVEDPNYPRYFFHDLRFNPDGSDKDFILNRAAFARAQIIVTERNWGCGSSRENAVTALLKNGVRCVIAPSFGDIHFSNCMKRGVLPVRLSEADCARLRDQLHASPGVSISVDLEAQQVTGPDQSVYPFEIESFDKGRMLKGLDDIDITMQYVAEIERYESGRAPSVAQGVAKRIDGLAS